MQPGEYITIDDDRLINTVAQRRTSSTLALIAGLLVLLVVKSCHAVRSKLKRSVV